MWIFNYLLLAWPSFLTFVFPAIWYDSMSVWSLCDQYQYVKWQVHDTTIVNCVYELYQAFSSCRRTLHNLYVNVIVPIHTCSPCCIFHNEKGTHIKRGTSHTISFPYLCFQMPCTSKNHFEAYFSYTDFTVSVYRLLMDRKLCYSL